MFPALLLFLSGDWFWVDGLLIGFIAWIVVMPLDAKRYGWTACFPLWLKILG